MYQNKLVLYELRGKCAYLVRESENKAIHIQCMFRRMGNFISIKTDFFTQ